MTDTDKPQTPNPSQTHTNHVSGHWDRWQTFRASKKQQFQMKFRFQLGFLWLWKAACFPSQPSLTPVVSTRLEQSKSLYQTFHREFRLINKPKKKYGATFYPTESLDFWIIFDCMKVEEMPNLQVQPVGAALVLLSSAPGIPQPHRDKKPQSGKGI